MSGTRTPSRKLSRTTTRVAPPSRRNAFSCNSAQMRELERNVKKACRLAATAQHHHEQSGASIFSGLRIPDHGAGAVVHLRLFSWSRQNHRAWLQWLLSAQLAYVTLDRLIATVEPI